MDIATRRKAATAEGIINGTDFAEIETLVGRCSRACSGGKIRESGQRYDFYDGSHIELREDGTWSSYGMPPGSGREPEPGTWAATARAMAAIGGDDGFDWDAWKDEMKDTDGAGY